MNVELVVAIAALIVAVLGSWWAREYALAAKQLAEQARREARQAYEVASRTES